MTDSLLNTSIATLRTELLAAIPTATASELMNIARSAKGLGLSEDTSIETAINSRANTLTNTATSEDIIKISGAVKQMLTPAGASGGGGGSVDLTAVSTNIIPDTDITYDLGSTTHKFKDLYLDGSTLNLGNQTIKATATGIEVPELKIGTGTNTVKLTVASDGKLTTTETDSSGNTSSPAAAGGGGSSVTVSDTAPTSPSAGDQWFDSSSLIMFVYYADGSSNQWVPATPAGQTGATGAAGADGNDGTAGYATVVTDMAGLIAITGMVAGQTALVTALNRVFMYTGSAWFLVATMTNDSPTAITGVNSTYDLAQDGTATTITAVSTDPEGFPLTWSYAVTTGSLGSTATVSQADNVFTVTPSTTEADAGFFGITFSVTDGATGAVQAVSGFTLGFGYKLTTASYDNVSFSVNSQSNYPEGMIFSDDGTVMVISDRQNGFGYQYALTSGFDISTATYANKSFDFSSQNAQPANIAFNNDGSKLYMCGWNTSSNNNQKIWEYPLSTAYDISTIGTPTYADLGTEIGTNNVRGLEFSPDGTKMIITLNGALTSHAYTLSTAFDVTTATLHSSFTLPTGPTVLRGLAFNPSGTKMFIACSGTDTIYEYDLSSGFDLSTASYNNVNKFMAPIGSLTLSNLCEIVFYASGSKMLILTMDYNDSIFQFSTNN